MDVTTHKVSDIAKALALSTRRVQQLVKEGILPLSVSGKYDLSGCITAYKKYLQQQIGKNASPSNLNSEKLRLLKAQADKAELEVQILEDKYIAVTEVELKWASLLIAFRSKMLALPTTVARQLIALNNDFSKIVNYLETEIHSALLELSKYEYEGATEYSESSSTASKAHN